MLCAYNKQQIETIRDHQLAKKQVELAESGIGSAIVNNQIITIGDSECNYYDWKHFVIGQIFRMGISQYATETCWDIDELKEDLAEIDKDSEIWLADAENYFHGMEGEF
jgi:hypothetical protein